MKLYEVACSDRSGEHTYDINLIHEFGKFSPEFQTPDDIKKKAIELYIESSQHEVLFSDYTRGDLSSFLVVFMNPRGVWLEVTRQTDNMIIGSMYLTQVITKFDANAHFTFWDSIARGREPIILKGLEFAFERYDLERVSVEVPIYQSGVIRFVRRMGFVEEGTKRHTTIHKGVWVDSVLFGYLREELEYERPDELGGELRIGDPEGDSRGSDEHGPRPRAIHSRQGV